MPGFGTRWLWLAYLVCGLLLAGASLSLPDLPASVVYQLTGLSAVVAYVLHREPFPSPPTLYLASYPLLAGALLVMIRSRTGGRDRAGLIDALIVATALACCRGRS